jgi:phage-related protein
MASMRWTVETFDGVDAEIEALPPGLQARLIRLMEAVENVGLEELREPHVKHLDGKLWELRAKASEGIARCIYVTVTGRRVVILHVFVKKSQKTPTAALNLARERMKRVKP